VDGNGFPRAYKYMYVDNLLFSKYQWYLLNYLEKMWTFKKLQHGREAKDGFSFDQQTGIRSLVEKRDVITLRNTNCNISTWKL